MKTESEIPKPKPFGMRMHTLLEMLIEQNLILIPFNQLNQLRILIPFNQLSELFKLTTLLVLSISSIRK